MPKKKWIIRIAKLIGLILFCIIFVPLVGVIIECKPFATITPVKSTGGPEIKEIKEGGRKYARSEDQTYLTLPEWYIVYSIDEYAAFVEENRPSHFPYFRAIRQYWRSYYNVCAITRDQYPFNSSYHTMLAIIGTSFTLENSLKGLYEGTFGRVTEWLSSSQLTEEDAYARQVAKTYGDFIHTIPWYEFPFAEKLKGLWSETSLWGPNVIRKWERKLALSLEYGLKSIYGWLLKQGTQATYSSPVDLEIQVWAIGISDEVLQQRAQIQIIETIDPQTALVMLPRYEAFTKIVPRLVKQGVQFVEIAGNDEILLTAIVPHDWEYTLPVGEILFSMEILTQPSLQRIAIKAPVSTLHTILRNLEILAIESNGLQLEHIYDY